MTEADEKEVRSIVQAEFLAILTDAQRELGSKDPTGMGRRALEGMAAIIRQRQSGGATEGE